MGLYTHVLVTLSVHFTGYMCYSYLCFNCICQVHICDYTVVAAILCVQLFVRTCFTMNNLVILVFTE